MRTIAIVNQKGGSGKTTTSVNLAASLAGAGKKVLLIDLDPQGSTSLWYGIKEKGAPLYNALTGSSALHLAIEKTNIEGLEIIPACILLSGAEKALAHTENAEQILKRKLEAFEHKPWDYVLIDCPPALGVLSLNALTLAKEVLVPVEAHVMALQGLVQLLKTINKVKQKLNPALEITGIVPCRVDHRTKHSAEVVAQLRLRFDKKVCESCIRENIRLAEAPLHMKPITLYDPSSNGAKDYMRLAEEIMRGASMPLSEPPAN